MSRIGFTISAAVVKIFLERGVIYLAKISVIMPLYNAEKFLEQSIKSVLSQTFKDFELILVDDCSTDGTLAVAESFDDARIKILRNKKNLGMPGSTRNVGLNAAQGEYVYFMDDDDVLLERGLEVLVDAAEKNSADVVSTTKWYISKKYEIVGTSNTDATLIQFRPAAPVSADLKTRIYQEFVQKGMHVAPWLFLYRREFLLANKIRFPSEVAEDVFFNFDVVCATGKIVKIDEPFYIWRPHRTSATHDPARLKKNLLSIFTLHKHIRKKLMALNDLNFTEEILIYWMNHVLKSYVMPFVDKNSLMVPAGINEVLEQQFGKNAPLVATFLQMSFQGIITSKENMSLRLNVNSLTKQLQRSSKAK